MSSSGLIETIQRRRLPHWLVVYAATAWGFTEATGFLIDNYGVPQYLLDLVLFLLLVLFFVVVVLAWYHGERGPQPPTRVEGVLLGLLLFVAVGGSIWISTVRADSREGPAPEGIVVVDLGVRSLAVLPFRSTVEDPGFAWLDRGIAELLSTNLAQVDDLRVVSGQRIVDLLAQLGVEPGGEIPEWIVPTLVELSGARLAVSGSIFGEPGDLTIAATLADASTGEIRASARARGADVFPLVDEIADGLRDGIEAGAEVRELKSIASLTTGSVDAYRAYEEGRRAFHRFLYADAAAHFERALAIDSTFALARFRRALSLHQLGSVSEAQREVRRARAELVEASERDRLFVEAYDRFSMDTTAAVAKVRELLRKYPDDKDARIIFANILASRRGAADPEARGLLVETLRLDPSYAPAYNVLAYSYARSDDPEAADSLSLRYVELEPDEPNSWDTRGEILELAGHVEDAREAYREALRKRPDFRFAIDHLARSYLLQNDPIGARRELATFRRSALPEVRVRAMALEADAYLWEGRVDEAVASYESAEREAHTAGLSGLRVWRLRDLVGLRLALGEYTGAVEAAETIRGLEPLDGWWITALYDSLTSAGDVGELERWKPRVQAEIGENPLTVDHLPAISRLIDVWIAYARGDHHEVLRLASELPYAMRSGVLTEWPVFRSMLESGEIDMLHEALVDYRSPDALARDPRFRPLLIRWTQYFEARALEAAGDTLGAVAAYQELTHGMVDGLGRFPMLSDVPARLEALTGTDDGAGGPN